VLSEPSQFGHGVGGDGDAAGRHRPRLGTGGDITVAELGDQIGRGLRRAGVVPQQCRPHDRAGFVEGDHSVLLPGDRDRRDIVQPSGLLDGVDERVPPCCGVDLSAGGVAGGTGAQQRPGVGVPDDDLAGLGGRVDAGYQRRHCCLLSGGGTRASRRGDMF